MMNDEDLLRAFAKDRSRAAFEEILRSHGGLVFGVCRRSLGNVQEAEDAAQSVFLIFLEKVPRLRSGTLLGAWLYRTAVFVSRNQIRSRLRRESHVPTPTIPAPPDRSWEEARPHLDDALARLPQKIQEALVVHYLQGQSLAETAATLDCPLKTLEKRVGRGLQRLRELLGGAGVAIGSAALVALLQQEARGATPARMAERLRSRPIPASPPNVFPKLLLPAATVLVAVGLVSGVLRIRANSRSEGSALLRSAAASPRSGGSGANAPAPSTGASTDSASPRGLAFPATFEEFAARYRRMRACPEALERWAALGIDLRPEEVLAAAAQGSDDDLDGVIQGVFRAWSARAPDLAADWIYRAFAILPRGKGWRIELVDGGEKSATLLEIVLENWFLRGRAAVYDWMKSLPPGIPREVVVGEVAVVASRLPDARLPELAELLDALPPSWARRIGVTAVSKAWAGRDPAAAAAWILKLPPAEFDPVEARIDSVHAGATFTLDEASRDNGLGPLAFQVDSPAPGPEPEPDPNEMSEVRRDALNYIARTWATSNLEDALQWAENLTDPTEQFRAMITIGQVWTEKDADAALEYARAHPQTAWRDHWIGYVADSLAPEDRTRAEALARLASDQARPFLLARILWDWGLNRPADAAPEAVAAMSALDTEGTLDRYGKVVSDLSRSWANKDPVKAAAWAAAIEREDIRSLAVDAVAQAWAQIDPRATLTWVESLLEGNRKALVVGSCALKIAATDPELAIKVATRLTPEEGRADVFTSIAGAWARNDPDTAIAWAQSLAVDQGRDAALLSVLMSWAERNPDAAQARVGTLANDDLKAQAAAYIEDCRKDAQRKTFRRAILTRKP